MKRQAIVIDSFTNKENQGNVSVFKQYYTTFSVLKNF